MLRTAWVSLQRRRWPLRWLLKLAFVAAVVFVVMYPRPGLFWRNLRHLRNLDRLIQPDAPSLKPWAAELRPMLAESLTPQQRLGIIEGFVYRKVPYEYDWVTWGVADYVPTVDEIVAQGREDCDGRAVIAASLLRPYDPEARIVTDGKHMWAASSAGEFMHPSGPKAMETTPSGVRIRWRNFLRIDGPAFGMAVFPLARELAILAAFWLALCDPRMSTKTAVGTALLAFQGLLMVRLAARNPWSPVWWGIWLGLAQMATAVLTAAWFAGRARRRPAGRSA